MKTATLDSVRDALGAELGDGRAVRAPRRAPADRTPKLVVKRRGRRRSAEDVAGTADTVLTYIKANETAWSAEHKGAADHSDPQKRTLFVDHDRAAGSIILARATL